MVLAALARTVTGVPDGVAHDAVAMLLSVKNAASQTDGVIWSVCACVCMRAAVPSECSIGIGEALNQYMEHPRSGSSRGLLHTSAVSAGKLSPSSPLNDSVRLPACATAPETLSRTL